jgi:metal-responsive CopG/Arc/MetJ family transcriptional regulator
MAKVMISFPDDLLARLDDHARRLGMTRSGLLQRLAEQAMTEDAAARRDRIHELLSDLSGHGGESAAYVREQRRAR